MKPDEVIKKSLHKPEVPDGSWQSSVYTMLGRILDNQHILCELLLDIRGKK